ncbi:PREDICTED: MIP18 family protein CG7949-like [Priapulus caudatus]|uniref:MIP18 family protein CG7949-like n=1 Tax=Priapulus caudatus TaxID=37621 RepID=A0ABM1ESD5_PRICU|nr:PREDICTED: MIP18 family protein CG7949-like [Priapulus caudatus]
MAAADVQNFNPTVFSKSSSRAVTESELDEAATDPIDDREVFDHLRCIKDPEHPLTLEELNVLDRDHVRVGDDGIDVEFTPTIPHCSMATLIGLSIRVKLIRVLPARLKVRVAVTPGTHVSEGAINKQLADKERVTAALENNHLLEVVNQCLAAHD